MRSSSFAPFEPHDEHNLLLDRNVRPKNWTNPSTETPYQLVVIGAGTAGLVTAAGAAGLGARVALIERERMGGDCLNVGCVPSKGIIRASRAASAVRNAAQFGSTANTESEWNFAATMERMRRLRASISSNDSVERFQALGVDVYLGNARFDSPNEAIVIDAEGGPSNLSFRKAVIATGARAAAPKIPGLDTINFLTNESVFSLTELPRRLVVIGSGPIGVELAQSFARFGSKVTLVTRAKRLLANEESDASDILASSMKNDGVECLFNVGDLSIRSAQDQNTLQGNSGGERFAREFDQLLVAVGRTPNIDGLNLDSAGVQSTREGVTVNDFLQTTNKNIFAAGDVCSEFKFTHAADFQARIVIQNALFAMGPFGRRRQSKLIVPWSTYTSPEIARVGLSTDEAEQNNLAIDCYTQSLGEVDRSILDGSTEGFVRVLTAKGTDRILGATIVAENAGDLISTITLAMNKNIGLAQIGSTIFPYPTQAEAIRKLGDQFNKTRLTSFSQKILGGLLRLNVGR